MPQIKTDIQVGDSVLWFGWKATVKRLAYLSDDGWDFDVWIPSHGFTTGAMMERLWEDIDRYSAEKEK